ncbi:MAG: putative metal-binding motif-containing protein [Sandaracinaceae bacterium]
MRDASGARCPGCDDGLFCNGEERCDPVLDCVNAPRGPCNDENVCTIDVCDEAGESCVHVPRDLDGDGDADVRCGGPDCDDLDPYVSSRVAEVCADFVDNDCDGDVDESACGRPQHDLCEDALDVSAGGVFWLRPDGALPDYPMSCRTHSRDLVATFTLTERRYVELSARGAFSLSSIDLRTTCAEQSSSLDCQSGSPSVIRALALDPGMYFVIVGSNMGSDIVELDVRFGPPSTRRRTTTAAAPPT